MRTNNQKANGVFLVIEGTDGSGKGTQFKLLADRLRSSGYEVATFDFPQYDNPSSYFVRQYLNGHYGSIENVGPYTGSIFYALDRYQAAQPIKKAIAAGKIVLANRFTGSNMAHQGTKFDHPEERRGYFIWLDNLEFQMLKIPRPDKSIVLRVPATIAQKLVDKKDPRTYTEQKRDLHEADLDHLRLSVDVYDDLCQLFPKDFTRLDCMRDNQLLDVETIHELLWANITPLLPPKPRITNPELIQDKPDNPYIEKTDDIYTITPAGHEFLADALTSTSDNVYAFTDKLSQTTIAAAMARLSRRGDDMRITMLEEFATAVQKDQQLLKRVITAYGDDSVQQLVGQHIVVEDASNLLTKKLERGRLAAYLEQSTRYIYYDKKDANGCYKYFVPQELKGPIKKRYIKVMDQIFSLYSQIARQITTYVQQHSSTPDDERDGAWRSATRAQACDAARFVLPVATKSTVGIFASGQALEQLIMRLLSDELPESQLTGQKILDHARQTIPTFLERADKPERGGATIAYRANTQAAIKKIATSYLSNDYSLTDEAVQLTSYWPRNELQLLADMLYEHSNLSLEQIQKQIDSWSIKRKQQVFKAYFGERLNRRHRPGRALEKAHYSWEIICDYGIFRDLQRHRMVDDLAWQELTPRYGYEIPALVEEAGQSDLFEKCFDLSLALFSELQAAGYGVTAQYATLLGHKMRWKVTYNARQAFHLHELRTSPQGHPGYRKIVAQLHEQLAAVHPLIASGMIFVNQDENPELTRLAAERYTQYKLAQVTLSQ